MSIPTNVMASILRMEARKGLLRRASQEHITYNRGSKRARMSANRPNPTNVRFSLKMIDYYAFNIDYTSRRKLFILIFAADFTWM